MLMKEYVAADTNTSAIWVAAGESLTYRGYSPSDSLRRRSPGSTGLCRLPDSKHICGADWAYTLSGRAAVFHRNSLGVAHLPLGPALHTIRFQELPPNPKYYGPILLHEQC